MTYRKEDRRVPVMFEYDKTFKQDLLLTLAPRITSSIHVHISGEMGCVSSLYLHLNQADSHNSMYKERCNINATNSF